MSEVLEISNVGRGLTPPNVQQPAAEQCFHCHDPLPRNLPKNLRLADKSFCCDGCKTVFEILNENDLCKFYDLDERAGNNIKNQRDARAYAWLDDPETAARLTDFDDGKRAKTTFFLPSMHCAACIWLLEHLYKLDAGVLRSTVHFPKKTVSIDFLPEKTSLRRLAAMLSSIGYPPEINLGDVSNTGRAAVADRSLIYKIGVAGFAFGNIMLLSFPEYLGLEKARDGWFFGVFGWLNLLIALPVLLFSATDYLRSAWQGLRNGHLNIDLPVSLGILMLFGRSVFEIVSGTGAGYMDSFAGLVFFLLCGKWFQQKTFHSLSFERDYRSYFPVAASVRRGEFEEVSTPLSKLAAGDRIVVRHGELIPADGILTHGVGQIDYSFVTGESQAVEVAAGEKVFAGGKNCGGELLEISLTRTVSQSYLTQLWNDAAFKKSASERGSTSEMADRVGKIFTILILAVGGAAFLFWWLVRGEIGTAVNAFTAVFMVACPCAIAISIPFTLGNVLRILGRHRFFVKNTQVLETLAAASAVVFDKTGTLTADGGRATVDDLRLAGVRFFPSENARRANVVEVSNLDDVFENLHDEDLILVKSITFHSNHPASRRIFGAMPEHLQVLPVEHFREEIGGGVSGFVFGKYVRLGSAKFVFGEASNHSSPLAPHSSKGVFLKIGVEVLGFFEIENRFREGLENVLDYLRRVVLTSPPAPLSEGEVECASPSPSERGAGGEVYLLSGDNDREAAELLPFFEKREQMFFNQSPQQKLDFIKKLQAEGQKVLFFGDGLNDAGALRQSDAGIVVTENTNNFTPASDAILHGGEFGRLPQFFEFVRASLRVVRGSFLLALAYNLFGLSFAVSGTLSPLVAAVLMPLSSVSVVLIGVFGSDFFARRIFETRI